MPAAAIVVLVWTGFLVVFVVAHHRWMSSVVQR